VGSFPRADVVLDPPHPEVAFVGRSNVGKSSLLNALVGHRIAKTSGTPGKTRMLNVFLATIGRREMGEGRDGPHRNVHLPSPISLYLLDLPGYGYSRVSKADRTSFRRLVHHALRRDRLAGVVWLLDLRHDPSADDRTMQDLLAEGGRPVLAALTKGDKLPAGQRRRRAEELRTALAVPQDQIVVTSARTGDGVPELRDAVVGLVLTDR
jgi:GTP-binding protein